MLTAIKAHKNSLWALKRAILFLFFIMLLVSCRREYDEVKHQRIKTVNTSDTINIAVIWDQAVKDFMLVEGVMLAADEINAQGGLRGRKLKIKVFYSKNNAHERWLAKKVAKDVSFAAIIGHRSSANAIAASIVYEYYGLLFVSPSASNNNLTNHGFAYTFRTIPSDGYVSKKFAALMKMHGHKSIAIIDDRGVYGKALADGVMESLSDIGLKTVVRRHYTPGMTDFKPLCADLERYDFDAIFLGGTIPRAAIFIREALQMGIKQRFYGAAAMDLRALERIAGKEANGTVISTYFNPDLDNPLTRKFVENFKIRHGKPPEWRAALGYDSLKILFEAMKRSKSAEPSVVAANMRFIKDWQGVSGSYTFNLQGDLVNKESYFQYIDQTGYKYFDAPSENKEKVD
ncbi:MAG: ABC transporter substrate-binding protein [Desulfuromonadales bacterium]